MVSSTLLEQTVHMSDLLVVLTNVILKYNLSKSAHTHDTHTHNYSYYIIAFRYWLNIDVVKFYRLNVFRLE